MIFFFCIFRDCVRGVGFEVLYKVFEIFLNIEDDELEVRDFRISFLSFYCVLNKGLNVIYFNICNF